MSSAGPSERRYCRAKALDGERLVAATDYAYDSAGRLQTLRHDLLGTSRDQDLGFTSNPASQVDSRSASNPAYAWTGGSTLARPYAVSGLNQIYCQTTR